MYSHIVCVVVLPITVVVPEPSVVVSTVALVDGGIVVVDVVFSCVVVSGIVDVVVILCVVDSVVAGIVVVAEIKPIKSPLSPFRNHAET